MLRVHHLADFRSQRVLWLMEELGLDYEVARGGAYAYACPGEGTLSKASEF